MGPSFPNGGIAKDQMLTSVAFRLVPTTLPVVQLIALMLPLKPVGIVMFHANARATRAEPPDVLQDPRLPFDSRVRVAPDEKLNSLFENALPQLPAIETKALML